MRTSLLLAWIAPLVALVGCDGSVKPDPVDDTSIGVDETGIDGRAEIEVDTLELDLGMASPGFLVSGTFTISNVGDADLVGTVGILAGGSEFHVSPETIDIAPGDSTTATVSFQGTTDGNYAGIVHIASNDADDSSIDIALSAAIGLDTDGDGWVDDEDCVDDDATIHPGAEEIWYDGIDQDCDGADDFDQDADGTQVDTDCDDLDASVGAPTLEVPDNGVDDDCDGEIDEAVSETDLDGDGYAVDAGDCDDLDASVNPGAEETWYDGLDQDCDGLSDYDADADGYDSDAFGGEDCDDADAAVNPGELETAANGIDDDCDGLVDVATDDDLDGWDEITGDCDDTDPSVYPGATEVWYDGVDQDCDGNDLDQDGDGYLLAFDCDDTDATINPGATDIWYDGVDTNCDGASDYDQDGDGHDAAEYGGADCDDLDATLSPDATEVWYDGVDQDCSGGNDYDQDGDGYGSADFGGDDCDDLDGTINPGAIESWYDGIDSDCNGASDYDADEDGADSDAYGGTDCNDGDATVYVGASDTWYDGVDSNCDGASDFDRDADGYDATAYGGTDCNDLDPNVYVGATETWYDGVDSDCSGGSDYDQDGDGVTSSAYGGTDCDDTNAAVYPGAAETWYDGTDSNCSGGSDYDQDGDGYTSSAYGGLDCADTDATISPAATEACDSVDNDCDGTTDESGGTWYLDADSDGYGVSTTVSNACTAPSGYVATSTDCNDGNAAVSPGDPEVCNGTDDDCDGTADDGLATTTYYRDADSDGYGSSTSTTASCSMPSGYVTLSTDCDDTNAAVSPADAEVCNSVDDDCDGTVDDGVGTTVYYADSDADGYGDAATSTTACTTPTGYVTDATDCNDDDATAYPGATEASYDASDNDCDGYQDEMVAETESGWMILGDDESDGIGGDLDVCEDLDGDGEDELVVGASGLDDEYWWGEYANAGGIGIHDSDSISTTSDFSDAEIVLWGNSDDDFFGSAFQVLGDLDSDGNVEIAVGIYQNDANETDDGSVYILDVDGWSDGEYTTSWYVDGAIYGDSDNGYYGYALAAGDFDGDGVNDLATGAPGEQSAKGRVYVTFASDDMATDIIDNTDSNFYVTGVSNSDHLGYSVAFGDFGGDGYDDLVACSPDDDDGGFSSSGTCWVINGASTRDTATSVRGSTVSSVDNAVITGSAASDQVGYTPQSLSVGDLDGDGRDDLAVGVPGYDGYTANGGGVWVYAGGGLSGAETVATATYVVRGDGALGTAVRLADVTGDGTDDLLAGATTAGSNKGVVYLFEGGLATGTYTVPTDQYASWTGESSGDLFGTAISGVWDLDGDGRDEFAVSATSNDDAASGAGKVYVLPAYP